MIEWLISSFINLVIWLVDFILSPIDILISSYIPAVSVAFDYVGKFFIYILNFIPFICSWLHFPPFLINLIIGYYIFKLTVPLLVYFVKLAINWYHTLKL